MVLSALQASVFLVLQSEIFQSSINCSHDEQHEQTEPEASRGKVRYSFANTLWDLASNRGGKRQRFGSTSATDQGVDQDTRDGSSSDTGGLSDVPQAVLANSIQPIFLQLQELDAEELLSLTRVETGGATLREGVQVRPIHTEITPPPGEDQNAGSSTLSSSPSVRYIHLQEVPDQYTMGVFVFPPHARIPLHDHPGMCVVSRILYGDVRRRSLDLPSPTDDTHKVSGNRRRAFYRIHRNEDRVLSYQRKSTSTSSEETESSTGTTGTLPTDGISKIPVDTLIAPQCTVLYPHQGNLHEFVAGPNGAAVLDVLLPPYNADHHRDCTFYDVVEFDHLDRNERNDITDHAVTAATIKDGSDDDFVSRSCWIAPTERPDDFHCISGQYRSLGR